MSQEFKSVLIVLMPAEEARTASPAAVYGSALAARFGGSVTLLSFCPKVAAPYSAFGGFAGGVVAGENERRRKVADAGAALAEAVVREAGLALRSEAPQGDLQAMTARLHHLSRCHDVTVIDAGADPLGDNRHGIEESLFHSGRPAIVVPLSGGDAAARRVAVAWDGSARSARAVADAMPLLKGAEAVDVAVVRGEKDLSAATPAQDIVAYLETHGVKAQAAALTAPNGDVSAALRAHIAQSRAELLVMGAFVHSRLRQTVFGGVTRSLLEDAPVPLLMSH